MNEKNGTRYDGKADYDENPGLSPRMFSRKARNVKRGRKRKRSGLRREPRSQPMHVLPLSPKRNAEEIALRGATKRGLDDLRRRPCHAAEASSSSQYKKRENKSFSLNYSATLSLLSCFLPTPTAIYLSIYLTITFLPFLRCYAATATLQCLSVSRQWPRSAQLPSSSRRSSDRHRLAFASSSWSSVFGLS